MSTVSYGGVVRQRHGTPDGIPGPYLHDLNSNSYPSTSPTTPTQTEGIGSNAHVTEGRMARPDAGLYDRYADKDGVDSLDSPRVSEVRPIQFKDIVAWYAYKMGTHGIVFVVLTVLSFVFHFAWLSEPPSVVWDETHFGKFANGYIKGNFFFDVHPPLGKMLIGLAGYLTGYDGQFEFKEPGQQYGETRYMGMRVFCSLMGAALCPLMYLTVRELTNAPTSAALAASLLLFDTGILTLTRYILLDSPLLLFVLCAVFCSAKFASCHDAPFTRRWWTWLTLTGASLACAFSVKWVGLFIIAYVGLVTIADLWDLLGDLSLTKRVLFDHFVARALCLIAIPAVIYMSCFYIHFWALPRSGPGDGFMSTAFQTTLEGNELYGLTVPEEIAYGSIISLKNRRSSGGLLHSHAHLYPDGVGARQQQITAYQHKDSNNHWLVKRATGERPQDDAAPQHIKHGDIVRLEHVNTRRNLHGHREKAPITTRHFQVTGYGNEGIGDTNDQWRVEVVNLPKDHEGKGSHVRVVHSVIRLVHVNIGCALHSHGKNLPKWGFEQLEVSCNPSVSDSDNLWNVEAHINPKLPSGKPVSFRPSFFSSFYELHVAMAEVNNGLKPKEGEVTSRPWMWPIDYRGQRFTGWGEKDHRVYLLGNPIVWYFCLGVMGLFVAFLGLHALMVQRGFLEPSWNKERKRRLVWNGVWLLVGWALHYLPFFLMGRVLYFHHYFPALLFSFMLTGIAVDYLLTTIRQWLGHKRRYVYYALNAVLYAGIAASFVWFRHVTFGMTGPHSQYQHTKLLSSWEF
eukprot:Opistho-2@18832